MLKFKYDFELLRDGEIIDAWTDFNLVPDLGVDYLAQAMFGDTTPIGTFYVGLFQNNYLPTSGDTSAILPGAIGEFVGYSGATRPMWNRVYDSAGTISNTASRATFAVTADQRLYGGFLISTSDKGGSTGLLLSIARFSSPRDVYAGATLQVTAGLTLIPTNVA